MMDAMTSALRAELESSFDRQLGLQVSAIILEKCATLCVKYKLTADGLSQELDAFLISNKSNIENGQNLTIENMGRLEQQIQNTNKKKAQNVQASSRVEPPLKKVAIASDVADKPKAFEGARVKDVENIDKTGGSINNSFESRAGRGEVVSTLNGSLGKGPTTYKPSIAEPLGNRAVITTDSSDFDGVTARYRYMYTNLHDRARALDKQITRMQHHMCEKLDITEVHPLGEVSHSLVWFCGRVCCEAAEGKLNSMSVLLEGSIDESNGVRVPLDLKEIPSFSLFPGQIILVQGFNPTGRSILAKQIIEGSPRPLAVSPADKLLKFHHHNLYQGGQPLRVVVASGPFTTSQNLDFEPLQSLLQEVFVNKPDVLILVGPFVDSGHTLTKDGDIILMDKDDDGNEVGRHTATFEMVFIERIIRDGLNAFFNAETPEDMLPTHFVLIPSLADGHHEFVFPQPPFGDRGMDQIKTDFFEEAIGELNAPFARDGDEKKRVHFMPNPCMFRINEVLFGTTSFDTLLALSGDEISQSAGNRIDRLAGHVLQQQSFVPLFPAPPTAASQFDFSKSKHWQMKTSPDVLLLPSKLAHMVKDISGTLVINPGFLARGSTGGTYAELVIHPLSESELRAKEASAEPVSHKVVDRTLVHIVKI